MSLNFFILFLWCLLTRVMGLFDLCNHRLEMKAGEKLFINSPYYPAEYPIGSSCRYALKAPQDYKLSIACNIKLNTPPLATKCQDDIFYFNSEGSEILTASEYFCGTGKMERKSFLNQAVISYISTSSSKRTQTKANTSTMKEEVGEKQKQKNKPKPMKKPQQIKAIKPATAAKLLKEHQLTITTQENATIAKKLETTTETIAVKSNLLTTSFTTPLPTSSAVEVNVKKAKDVIEEDKKVNNLFAYVVTLLSHNIDRAALATAAKLLKTNTTTTTETTGTTMKPPPATSRPISVLKFNELLPVASNDSMATNKISTKRVAKVIVGHDYTTSTTGEEEEEAAFKNSSSLRHNLRAANGGGSFSCLVEVIQPPCECGWGSTVKIAGATGVAGIAEFPSMAGIMTIKNQKIFCGATIIHQRYLLSAAHCYIATQTNSAEYLTAVVGEHDLSTVTDSFYTRQYDLIKIILHEQFKASSHQAQHDIALLKTRYAMEWSRSVGPVCLPFMSLQNGRESIPYAGQRVVTAGWGTTSFGGQQSSLLLKTTLDVIAHASCAHLIGNLHQGVFCTYTPGRDTCQYDSGGALYERRERLFAVGVVSYGFACATKKPSVNTRISAYLKWIVNKTPDAKYCLR